MQSRAELQSKLVSLMGERRLPLCRAERAVADWALMDDHLAVLDLNCGQGQLLAHFAQRHHLRACGLCHDPMQAQELRSDARAGEIMYAAGAEVPWQDATFDRVLLTRALPTAMNADELLRETLRVLRPGGTLLCAAGSLPLSKTLTLPWSRSGRPISLRRGDLISYLERLGYSDVLIRQSRPGWAVAVGHKAL